MLLFACWGRYGSLTALHVLGVR